MNLKSLSQLGAADPLPLQLGPKVEKPADTATASAAKQVAPGIFQQADGKLFTQLPLPPKPETGRLGGQAASLQNLPQGAAAEKLFEHKHRLPRVGSYVPLPNGSTARIRSGNAVAGWRLEGYGHFTHEFICECLDAAIEEPKPGDCIFYEGNLLSIRKKCENGFWKIEGLPGIWSSTFVKAHLTGRAKYWQKTLAEFPHHLGAADGPSPQR